MKIKRFVAKDMRTALTEVKEFLGPDAIILSNKKVAEGVEIVAAIDQEPAPAAKPAPAAQPRPEPRFSATVADDDEAEAPADSLKALLARQMIKQQVTQNAATKPLLKAATQEAPRAAQFERQTSGAAAGGNTVQLTELTKLQEQQAKLVQQQMDAMRNEMLSMRQLLQHQVSGLMWQDLARREPVRALIIENLQQLGLSEQVADQLACFMPEELNSADAWEAAL